ncbi:MAG TPA: hypothetical protein VMR86_08385 [Myxococcota bacterium]|nr:hypothetical protein [Myxococcota bacterium]
MARLAALVLSLATLASAQVARAQSLWGPTQYGMSVAQVRESVPGVLKSASPSKLGDGALGLLEKPGIALVGHTFTALFYFKGERLSQVTLTLAESSDFSSALLVFESLTDALRAKYGSEVSRKLNRGFLSVADSTWVSGRTNLTLYLMAVGNSPATLNLNYQVRLAQESDKL